jgi:hypothetical protein
MELEVLFLLDVGDHIVVHGPQGDVDIFEGCCQTDANQSLFRQVRSTSVGAERPPLGKSGGASQLVGVSAREAPFDVEVVAN